MTEQLPLLAAMPAEYPDTGEDHQWAPGDDLVSDIDRPIAYLYVRPAMLSPDDRKRALQIARACTGVEAPDGVRGIVEGVIDDASGRLTWESFDREVWVRLNGDGGSWSGRQATRDVTPPDEGSTWRLEFLNGDTARPAVARFRDGLRPGLLALGVAPGKCNHIRLPHLSPLILALRWDDAVSYAVALIVAGVAPRSAEWAVRVDRLLADGDPAAEALALLSARHPRDVMSRALAWAHENRAAILEAQAKGMRGRKAG